jgi:hypothetical protein
MPPKGQNMKTLSCLCCAFNGGVVAALLAGCGGAQSVANLAPLGQRGSIASKRTFAYTGNEQQFMVPAGVTQIVVTVDGASGAPGADEGYSKYASAGGLGSRVRATIPVTPRETLAIFVGGDGSDGGFNGGGAAGGSSVSNGHGGGASDVRQGGDQLADRVLVGAGGGGGGEASECISTACGYSLGGDGGIGGKKRGGLGGDGHSGFGGSGGGGGGQGAGGRGGAGGTSMCGGSDGQQGTGGTGGGTPIYCGGYGGGGGGGYYGGGGGGGGGVQGHGHNQFAGAGGGGGGGSSFAEKRASNVSMHAGKRSGNGLIVISW